MSTKYIFLIFVVLMYNTCEGQFIMDPMTSCQFELNGKKMQVTGEVSVITVKSRQLTIALSPCVHFSRLPSSLKNAKKYRNCPSSSRACIIEGNTVIDAGNKFIYTDEESQHKEKVLVSCNGDKCPNGGNYKVIIHFNCNRIKPWYIPPGEEDDIPTDPCTYHIEMIAPNCTPHCMARIAGQFLNLKDLIGLPDVIVPTDGNRRVVLSMCRPTAACNATNNTVACEIETATAKNGNVSKITRLGTWDTEKTLWDEEKQQLYLRSQVGKNKKSRRITEIRLICNWNADSMSNARITKNSDKMMVFEVESKFGCVKLAPNCKVKNSNQFTYNLENLYKTDNWLLNNTSTGTTIVLNICGPLKLPRGSACQKSYSQICDEASNVNYGSIMRPIQVDQFDNFLTTSFIGGSVCASNTSRYYSTNIKFVCSLTNMQPKFINEDKCCVNILWETSEACPKYISSGKNCKVPISTIYIKNRAFDLNELHTSIDRSIALSGNLKLIYNFCGKLASACNNITEASMCLVSNNKESVLGLENNEVTFENGVMRSYFYNGLDFDEEKPNVNVSFICNHNRLKEGVVSVYSLQDKLAYQMTVETPLACYTDVTYPCTFTHENQLYDLTPLMRNDSNYEISTNQFKFHINICRPVLIDSQSLCSPDSLMCLTNVTEARISKRFFSLGSKQNIDFHNGLTLNYTFGSSCPNSYSFSMEATIRFSCASNQETGPILIESNKCNHTITWATRFACPKKSPLQKWSEKECLVKIQDKIIYNFTSLKVHNIKISLENNVSITLNICNGLYSLYHGKDVHREQAISIFHPKENNPYLQFDLIENYSVKLNFQCDYDDMNEGFESISKQIGATDKKKINFILKSSAVCTKNIENIKSSTIAPIVVPQIEFKKSPDFLEMNHKQLHHEIKVPLENNTKNNCAITSASFETLSLNSLPPLYVQSEKHSYYVDFNNTVNCKSYVCKDNIPFVHHNNSECPKYKLDGENLSIKFALLNESICKDRDLRGIVLLLECGTKENTSVIQESDCYVEISYRTASVCSLSNNLALLTNTEDNYEYKLGGIIVVCILLTIVLIVTILRYLRKKRQAMAPALCRNIEFASLVKQD